MKTPILLALCFVASTSGETVKLGDFKTYSHDVTGEVFAVDDETILIKGFNYDGQGPDAFFWVGHISSNVILCCTNSVD